MLQDRETATLVELARRRQSDAPEPDAQAEVSFAQQRLWFLAQLDGGNAAYHVPLAVAIKGQLDVVALRAALDRIVLRHEALRTTFAFVRGGLVQRVVPASAARFTLDHHDVRGEPNAGTELRRLVEAEARTAFDLERGPLVRGRLIRDAEESYTLLITMHHIVSDGWSMNVLKRELSALYGAYVEWEDDPLEPLPVQYADFAAWQREWIAGERLQRQERYWRDALAGAPALLELPADRPRPAQQDFAGAIERIELDAELTAAAKALGRKHGTTTYTTLLAAWSIVLARLSGQADVVVGTPVANRDHAEVEPLIGFFVNTLPVRLDVAHGMSAGELLAETKQRVLAAQQHQDIPFEQIVDLVEPARSLSYSPIFQTVFAWGSPPDMLALAGLETSEVRYAERTSSKFDLTLTLRESDDTLVGSVEYATALFDPSTIERFGAYLRQTLEAMVADDRRRVEQIDLLTSPEREQVIVAWNDTERAIPHASLPALFEAHVRRAPDAVAVRHDGVSLTYAELNARANRLAAHLQTQGVVVGSRVALVLERSIDLIVAQLAVLKCGAAYAPLAPDDAAERLQYLIEDCGAALVIANAQFDRALSGGRTVVDAGIALLAGHDVPAAVVIEGDAVAYVMYTSGSTGEPKGVMVPHQAVVRTAVNNGYAEFTPSDRVAFAANPAFDAATLEVWGPLLSGGAIVVVDQETLLAPSSFGRLLADEGVTVLWLTVGLFNQYADILAPRFAKLRYLITGGDALDPAVIARVLRQSRPQHLLNGYGPTETTTFATTYEITAVADDARSIPIGRPIGNTRIYVLDESCNPVPVGVTGELYIGGLGVALGYLNRPELNRECFIPSPFVAGDRLYKTGDLGRWLADGTIDFVGRNDGQVKLRGFRVELGEIESSLATHPSVEQAIVIVRGDDGEKQLVAYYTSRGAALTPDVVRAHLVDRLPGYMIPAAFVRLETVPLTPNGKLDRAALPVPDASSYVSTEYAAPHGEIEAALAQIWSDLLKVERVGRHDNFFELGGHSLLAVRAVNAIRDRFAVEVAVGDLFAHPVLEQLARSLQAADTVQRAPIVAVERSEQMPMSFAQQRLWFLAQMKELGEVYHVPFGVRLQGEVDVRALRAAFERVIERHEVLRTTFAFVHGQPVQRVTPADKARIAFAQHDLRGEPHVQLELHRRLLDDELKAPFDLEHGPLIRARLIRDGELSHMLLVTMHHIVADGWSMGIFAAELSALYNAFARGESDPLAPLPVQYADYAVWQRSWVEGDALERQARYWQETLADAPALVELPADRARPAQQEFTGAFARLELDPSLTAAVKALSRQNDTTLFMTLLAAWSIVLARLSGQDDLVVGTPVANRGQGEIEALIGFFVNTLPLRLHVDAGATVAEVLAQTKAHALAAQENQDIPFEHVVQLVQPVRSLSHSPVFQTMFVWQDVATSALAFEGIEASALPRSEHKIAKFDLTMSLFESGDRIVGGMEYATALFDAATIDRFGVYLRTVLEAMVQDDRRTVHEIEIMPPSEREQVLVQWNDTERAIPNASLPALFEVQVRRTPDAVAVQHGDAAATYAELNRRANRLAAKLRSHGAVAGSHVVIVLERSIELVVAQLAVMKCGAAYVPLEPEYSVERLQYLIEDSGAALVISTRQGMRAGDVCDRILVDAGEADSDEQTALSSDDGPSSRAIDGNAPAYVMYTSGSTGRPKGVIVPHRAVVRLVVNNGYTELAASDRVAFAANPAFDAATFEVWGPLLNGGTIVVADQETLLSPSAFGRLLDEQGVTVLWLTVGLFNQYADVLAEQFAKLRYLITGGDALDPAVIARVLRQGRPQHLLNGYGPTETTTFAATYEITASADGVRSIPIGRPIGNTRIYVLDESRNPVPVGVTGELYIGGLGVALGYLNAPELNAERFMPSPFVAGDRLYKTGDLGRWLADGTIDFIGRNDGQVKLRGFRVELGEIESSLATHPSVEQAIVIVRGDDGEKQLVAYYTARQEVAVDELRAHLARHLPGYMVPAAFVRLDTIPLTANGKIDRAALPVPDASSYVSTEYAAPHGEAEAALAEIWSNLLKIERVGRHDNFFELGGHSLLAVRAVNAIRDRFAVEVAVGDLFAHPVLEQLARSLQAATALQRAPLVAVERSEQMPMSFAQQRLWFLAQMKELGEVYHVPFGVRLHGELDARALRAAFERVIERHEVLRTTFAFIDGQPMQRVMPAGKTCFAFGEHDLRGEPHVQLELHRRLLDDELKAPFDLEHGPLIRARLIRDGELSHMLLVTMHHIVADGWSMGIFASELSALYNAFARGESDPLAPLPVQYADYAVWQRAWVEGEALERQARYWQETLADAPALLELPADRPRPAQQEFAGAFARLELDPSLSSAVKALSRQNDTTLFMTLLAAWSIVLARLSGQDDLVVGTPVANRGQGEIEALIGFFVNTLPLRLHVDAGATVAEVLAQTKAHALAAQEHQDIPFEHVVQLVQPVRSLSHSPVFQTMFVWQDVATSALAFEGIETAALPRSEHKIAKFDLTMSLFESGDRIVGGMEYATSLFDAATIDRFGVYLRTVLEAMVQDDRRTVDQIEIMPPSEREQVLARWNDTERAVPELTFPALFEAQASRTPNAVALAHERETVTYADLNARANRLAHELIASGVGPGDIVALALPRGIELIVALLATVKSGAAYLPIDPGYPADRRAFMVSDANPVRVLASSDFDDPALLQSLAGRSVENPIDAARRRPLEIADPAYVIYTSGSTGVPKGVVVTHRGIANFAAVMVERFEVSAESHVLQLASSSFDAMVLEVLMAFGAGARLVLPRAGALVGDELTAVLQREAITHTLIPPSVLATVDEAGAHTVRTLIVGGEACPPALASRWARGRRLINAYGPTEFTVVATMTGPLEPDEVMTIGRPISNAHVYILDPQRRPVPVGTTGEMYLGGISLAQGYLNRPALTEERFIADPFSSGDQRLYKTGDLARWRPDGTIEYLGRNDDQVKLRGLRVELGEIESALLTQPAVEQATVIVRAHDGDERLVAYYTAPNEAPDAETLRSHLADVLPSYMVPSAFVRLNAIPLTPNGKVDRNALPAPDASAYAVSTYEAPRGEVELALAEIWSELLKVERIGCHDNFFHLGGHSLLAISVVERLRRLGMHADVRAMFEAETLRALAQRVEVSSATAAVVPNRIPSDCDRITPEMVTLVTLLPAEIERIVEAVPGGAKNVADIYPLAPLQEGILYHHLSSDEGDLYLLAQVTSFASRTAVERHLQALQAVIDRHDILRTAILWEGLREPVQVVLRRAAIEVEEVVLEQYDGDAGQQLYAKFDPRHYRLDLRRAPLLRAAIAFDERNGSWLLLQLMHHAVADHSTLELIEEEVQAHLRGAAASLPSATPFRNLVAAARSGARDDEHRAHFEALLGDVEEPTVPFGLRDVRTSGDKLERGRAFVDPAIAVRLREHAARLSVGAASLHHVACAQVLARASGRSDVVFGTVLFGRMHGGDGSDRAVGPFINTLPVRIDVSENPETVIRSTHGQLSQLLQHEHASLAMAQRCSAVAPPNPLFSCLLNYRHTTLRSRSLGSDENLRRVVRAEEASNYPLAISIDDLSDGGFIVTVYVDEVTGAARVCEMMQTALRTLVAALDEHSATALAELDVMAPAERELMLVDWNATARAVPGASLCALFEAQAMRTPDAVAVQHGEAEATYEEVRLRARALAARLKQEGVAEGSRVAVVLERSIELVVAEVAIVACGAAYVPLDPDVPDERLRFVLDDAGVTVIVSNRQVLRDGVAGARTVVDVDAPLLPASDQSALAATPLGGGALAYVMYTSGSTGRPKGVMVPHRAVVRLVLQNGYAALRPDDRIAALANPAFDASTFEVWGPLLTGARAVIVDKDIALSPALLARELHERGITAMFVTTALFNQIALTVPEALGALRYVLFGGEAVDPRCVEAVLARGKPAHLMHVYGPTETTTFATSYEVVAPEGPGQTIPIGRPIGNTSVYILDARRNPVPVGVAGEVYVGGMGVALGYLNRPELTRERFTASPFVAGERLYKTGDLARYRADGAIEYLGRNDDQVKLRGFRIELGEIESSLLRHESVGQAAVAVRSDDGEKQLVAYYTSADDALTTQELRAHCAGVLPSYMVPAAFVRLDALPLTPNGKTDRQALPPPDASAYAVNAYEPPQGDIEIALAQIWSKLLKVERVGRHDDFFHIGGHSLLAVRAVTAIHAELGTDVAVGDFFAHPVLKDLARTLHTAPAAERASIVPVRRSERMPVSFAQQRLLVLAQLDGASEVYNVPFGVRLHGELNARALRASIDRIVERHEALRTRFAFVDGEPVQRVIQAQDAVFALHEHDLRESANASADLRRLIEEEAAASFDLENGLPVRGRLIRDGDSSHVLLVTVHHVVSDGWSMGVFAAELSALYNAFARGESDPLAPLPVQYPDYAVWQRERVEGELLKRQSRYWRETLAGAPPLLELPADRPRPTQQDFAGAFSTLELGAELTSSVKALSRKHDTTLFATLLTAWGIVLGRLSGQPDVVIGTPVANRGQAEIQALIGFFVNTLALRLNVADELTVGELLAETKTRALAAQEHQDIPFEHVVQLVQPVRSLSHSPVVQVAFGWQNVPAERLSLDGLQVGKLERATHTVSRFDLSLSLSESGDRIVGGMEYATALFDAATIERFGTYLRTVLEAMVQDDPRTVDQIAIMPPSEREQVLVQWNDTQRAVPELTFPALFEAQVSRTPDAVALAHERETVTYAELNARANRLAHELIASGVAPGDIVALSLPRGVELIVSLLATVKSGAAYLPIDPGYPADRRAFMVSDANPVRVLVSSDFDDPAFQQSLAGRSVENPTDAGRRRPLQIADPAYVIYTSGSTGVPKGVVVTHRGIANLAETSVEQFAVTADAHVLQLASSSFDAMVIEVLMAFAAGARLVLPRAGALVGDELTAVLEREAITHTLIPPSVLATVDETGAASVRTLIVGGEACPPALASRWARGRRLINAYGPTEFTVVATMTGPLAPGKALTIGRPISNARVYILDPQRRPVPVGATGEMYLGGISLAQGYLNRPALTAERFIADPFSDGERLYKTGDLARWRPDGTIEYLGRNDDQVKLRGLRVELGEIESALLTQPAVEQATVIVRAHHGDERLLAYYTSHDETLNAETLRSHLADVLPSYMVPAAFVRLNAIPLTPNGKVDRSALPAPDASAYAVSTYEAPCGEVEVALAEIWAKLLGVERVGRCDNFFDLGGHSLLAMRVVGAVRRELHVELALGDLFTHPTLDELADHVIMMQLEQFDPNELRRLVGEDADKELTARANSGAF